VAGSTLWPAWTASVSKRRGLAVLMIERHDTRPPATAGLGGDADAVRCYSEPRRVSLTRPGRVWWSWGLSSAAPNLALRAVMHYSAILSS
jgi:hypothetical protein